MSGEHTPIEKAGADLRAAITRMPELTLRVAGRWSPALSFMGAALAVILVIGVPVLFSQIGSDGEGPLVGGTTSTTTATTVFERSTTTESPHKVTTIPTASACGSELPFATVLPADFTGPTAGPSPDSPHPAEEGQGLWHWTGRGGSVEMRWPANIEYTESVEWGVNSMGSDTDEVMFVALEGSELDGVPQLEANATLPTDLMDGPCDAVQLSVFASGEDGSGAELLGASFGITGPEDVKSLILYPNLPRPRDLNLIVDSLSVETVPDVLECSGGPEAAGFEVPPIETETITDRVVFSTPVGALEGLLGGAAAETWPKTGYFELHEPDGSITYGNPIDDMSADPRPENGLVVSVSVVQQEDGWAVDSWSTSGC